MSCIEGDLFENGADIENPSEWQAVSHDKNLQAGSRYKVVKQFSVDFIIPGHGPMFPLTADHLTLLQNQQSPSSSSGVQSKYHAVVMNALQLLGISATAIFATVLFQYWK